MPISEQDEVTICYMLLDSVNDDLVDAYDKRALINDLHDAEAQIGRGEPQILRLQEIQRRLHRMPRKGLRRDG
jgi:hypothetical protein